MTSPVLDLPRDQGEFVVDANASERALGAVLSQKQEGVKKPVAYYSRLYSQAELNYCTTRKELSAVLEALRQFRPYILGRHFRVRSDHAALQRFQHAPNPVGQQVRWLDVLGKFDFALSRGRDRGTVMPTPYRVGVAGLVFSVCP